MSSPPPTRPRAVLVGVQLHGVSDTDHASDLAELGRLVHTLGFDVVATVTQRRDTLAAAAVVGEGKLKELADLTGGKGVVPSGAKERKSKARDKWEAAAAVDEPEESDIDDNDAGGDASEKATVVVVDHEISPSQARNLERATGAQVLDRTGVIVDIFHRHAKSREARLQVEIARLNYVAPRMREAGGSSERQHGRGAGESAMELDRRKIRDRIAELREELVAIQKEQDNRRYARKDQLRVALVGYTNAGKSSLMRALTGSEVLVADKLFATLDTTVRALHPETKPRILVSDTVGFIQKLPHDLVASFRSTLDEALEASLLLYVVDAADPTHEAQLEVTRSVLREIGASDVPSLLLLNKADRLDETARRALLRTHPDAIILSAHDPADVTSLRQTVVDFFEARMVEEDLLVPYARQSLLGDVYESARVVAEEYDEKGTRLRVRGLPAAIAKLRSTFAVLGAMALFGCTPVASPVAATVPAIEHVAPSTSPELRAILAAADRSDEDRALDAGRKPAELFAFAGVRPGMKVADIGAWQGYTAELLARAVSPDGTVYAVDPPAFDEYTRASWNEQKKRAAFARIVRVARPYDDPLPPETPPLDIVFCTLFYHDMVWLEVDRAKMNAALFRALKPDGSLIVADHSARAGDAARVTKTLHRIEESVVVDELRRAGFILVADSDMLRHPEDARDWSASDEAPAEKRGKSDRFVLRFRRP